MKQSNDKGEKNMNKTQMKDKTNVSSINCQNKENNLSLIQSSSLIGMNSKSNADVYFKLLTEEKDRLKIKYQKQQKLKQKQIIELKQNLSLKQHQCNQKQRMNQELIENNNNYKNNNDKLSQEIINMSKIYEQKFEQIKKDAKLQIQKQKKQNQHLIGIKKNNQSKNEHEKKQLQKQISKLKQSIEFKQKQHQSKLLVKLKQKQQIENLLAKRQKQNLLIIQQIQLQNINLKKKLITKENKIQELLNQIYLLNQDVQNLKISDQNKSKLQLKLAQQTKKCLSQQNKLISFASNYIKIKQNSDEIYKQLNVFIKILQQKLKQQEKLQKNIHYKIQSNQKTDKNAIKILQQQNQFLREQMKKNLLFTKMIQDIKSNSQLEKQNLFQHKPQYIFKDVSENNLIKKQKELKPLIKKKKQFNQFQLLKQSQNTFVSKVKVNAYQSEKVAQQSQQFLRNEKIKPQRCLNAQSQRCLNIDVKNPISNITLYEKQLQQLKSKTLHQIQSSFYSQMRQSFQNKIKEKTIQRNVPPSLQRSHSCNQKMFLQIKKQKNTQRPYPYQYLQGQYNCSLNVIEEKQQTFKQDRRKSLPSAKNRGLSLRQAVTQKCKNALKKQK